MRFRHSTANSVPVATLPGRNGPQNSLIFTNNVMATVINQVRQIRTMSFQLSERDITERLDVCVEISEELHAFFTLCPTIVVLSTRMLMFDHRVANDHGHTSGHLQELVLERPAIEQDGFIGCSYAGCGLVHDSNSRAYKFVLRSLADSCNFSKTE